MDFQYYDLENEIVDYLQPLFTALADVVKLPENQFEFKRSTEKALIVVAFAGSDFDPPAVNDATFQLENISVLCNVTSSTLRNETGIHNIILLLKKKLQGFRSQYLTGRLFLKSIQYDDRNENTAIFSYNVEFSGKKPQVQEIGTEDDAPVYPLNTLNINDNY